MSAGFLEEVARAPKANRMRVSDVPGYPELVRTRVTETVNMRNSGSSPVNTLMKDGWYKPASDSPMLEMSPDGNSFWMYKMRDQAAADKGRNNERAKRMEGFRDLDGVKEFVKEANKTEDTKMKGAEMIEEIEAKSGQTVESALSSSDDHNG